MREGLFFRGRGRFLSPISVKDCLHMLISGALGAGKYDSHMAFTGYVYFEKLGLVIYGYCVVRKIKT